MRSVCCITSALWLTFAFAEEIAFLPYKVDVPTKEFPVAMGNEYAKMLATAASIAKLQVHSPRDIEADLVRNRINPQGTVSADDLMLLGKSRLIDYFAIGTIYKKSNGYNSESVLFSVSKGSVVVRAKVSATNLFELAERELWNLFSQKAKFPQKLQLALVDLAIVVDGSHGVAPEWNDITRGMEKLAREITAMWNANAQVSIIPFSKIYGTMHASLRMKNAFAFARELERIIPKGGNDAQSFANAFDYAVKNLQWRSDASKQIILISNTPISDDFSLRNCALKARQKGIVVHTIALAGITGQAREYFMELSRIANGRHFDAAYYRKLTDAKGESINLYLEAGRLFTTIEYDDRWQEGLLSVGERGIPFARPKKFVKEIFFDEKTTPLPSTMAQMYQQYAKVPIVQEGPLRSNIATLCSMIPEKIQSKLKESRSIGRVLVSQGTHSLWMDIVRNDDLEFFRKKIKSKEIFLLGVSIEEKRDEPFGFRFNPHRYVVISQDYVPQMLTARLEEIISNPSRFVAHGIFEPPIWFVELKAERVKFRTREDVRNE
ncbi:MAG: VWA domain-containing protein [Spirochaetes bacterium]|nr:VWA domain-containing protein [Spirochaetota bacterium]